MKFRNTILRTVAAAVAALGLVSTDAVAQIAGPAPTTSSAFRMYNSGSNWITIAAGPTAGTGTFLWPAVSAGVFKSDVTGTMSIGQITATDLELTQNSMFVGGPGNTAIELAAGTAGQVLQIVGGSPTWSTINLLPNGGGDGQTLYWDGDSWESTNSVNVNVSTGAVTINDDLAVTGDVTLPNGVINNNELENDDINLTYGTGISGDASVVLGGTLNLQNTGVTGITAGTGISVSGATGNVTVNNTGILNVLGTPNQVNVSTVAGVSTLSTPQNIDMNATPTFDGLILDNLTGSSTSSEVLVIGAGDQIETRTMNILPGGSLLGNTLYWDGDSWESTNALNVNPATGTTVNGDLTVTAGNDVVLPNGVINNNELENDDINLTYGTGISGDASVVLGGTLNLQNTGVTGITAGTGISVSGATGNVTVNNTGILNVLGTPNQVNVSTVAGVSTLSTPQNIDMNATPTFDGLVLDNLSTTSPLTAANNVLITDAAGNVTETSPNSVVAAATLPQNNIYVGDATNHPAAVAPGSTGDVLTINGSGTPTWSTPTGTIAAKGKVTGTGTWTYTVNPGVNPSGAATVIMVTLTSTSGLQVTHVVNNITATTFDVQFPVNIGGTETFHWMVIQ